MKNWTRSKYLFGTQNGGITLSMLIVMLVMVVPISMGAIKVSGQYSISSRVLSAVMEDEYSASAGQEFAFYKLLNDPAFVNSMTQESPTASLDFTQNGKAIDVTVTKVTGASGLEGQALEVTKAVSPTTAPINTATTFTYTLTIKNQGTQPVLLRRVTDFLPPRFSYSTGTTTGLTANDPSTGNASFATCGATPVKLTWDVSALNISIGAGAETTLTFDTTGTLPDGTYYNQASARYTPWWGGGDVDVYSQFMSPVTVGTGSSECGYEMVMLLTKTVTPTEAEPGVETTFTYTITAENIDTVSHNLCIIYDILPPTFTYVSGSSDVVGNISTSEPAQTWLSTPERWQLRWGNTGVPPMLVLGAGEIRTQVFQAEAIPQAGASYFNEISFRWTDKLPAGKCQPGSGNGSDVVAGAGDGASVDIAQIFDVLSTAGNKTVKTRVEVFAASNELNIYSWQVE